MTHDTNPLAVMRRVLTAYETHDLLGMEAHMQELRGAIAELETREHSIEIQVYGQTVTFVTREPMSHYSDGDRFYRHPPESAPRIECSRCGRILADVPPAGDTFAERWRNVTGAIKGLL